MPPKKLCDKYWTLSKISEIIVLLILTVIVMGASAESKISSIMLGKSEIAGKLPVNEINFIEREKKVRRVKIRGGKRPRNYYPIKDGRGTDDLVFHPFKLLPAYLTETAIDYMTPMCQRLSIETDGINHEWFISSENFTKPFKVSVFESHISKN